MLMQKKDLLLTTRKLFYGWVLYPRLNKLVKQKMLNTFPAFLQCWSAYCNLPTPLFSTGNAKILSTTRKSLHGCALPQMKQKNG